MSIEWTTGLPVLRRGPHRHPRSGGCFMEYASLLAGEPWSDHPDCTHPLLALVAREVNDETTDAGRPLLAPLIPSVIGVRTADPAELVLRCVPLVTPVVSVSFRRLLDTALAKAAAARSYPAESAAPVLAGAVRAVTDFRAPDPDSLLRAFLVRAITTCARSNPVSVPAGRGASS